MSAGGEEPDTQPVSSNMAAVNPFTVSGKENFPSIDEVFAGNGANHASNDGSEPVSLDGGRSFQHVPLSKLFSQSQMQQMKAAERSLKGELSTDETASQSQSVAQSVSLSGRDAAAKQRNGQSKFVKLVPLVQAVRPHAGAHHIPAGTTLNPATSLQRQYLPQQSAQQSYQPVVHETLQQTGMAKAQPAQSAAQVLSLPLHPTIHLPPGTSVTLIAGEGNQGTIVQLHQDASSHRKPEASHGMKRQSRDMATFLPAATYTQDPATSQRRTGLDHTQHSRTQAVSATLQRALSHNSPQATPSFEGHNRAAAVDLNLVSASYLGSELAHEAARCSVLHGVDDTRTCTVPAAPDSETAASGGTPSAPGVHHDQQDEDKATMRTVATQSSAQVASQSHQFPSVGPSEQRSITLSRVPSAAGEQAHAASSQAGARNTENRWTVADQHIDCEQRRTAERRNDNVPTDQDRASHGCRAPEAPTSARGQPLSAQPTASSYRSVSEAQHTQCPRQSDATTQTPPRQQPKRKLQTRDNAGGTAPVPFARRKVECSPRPGLGAYRAPSAAWAGSPAALRTAQSPGILAWPGNTEGSGRYNTGLPGCMSPGMQASQLAFAPPSIVRQALQHHSPPVRLPPGAQVPMVARPMLGAAMASSPAGSRFPLPQTPPRIQQALNSQNLGLTAAQLHGPASAQGGLAADDLGCLERGISLRDGIVLGSHDAGGSLQDQAPAMQLPLMLGRFIYDT